MRLKYKKLIVFVSLGTLFLSFIILSMVPTGGTSSIDPENAEISQDENVQINDLITKYFTAKQAVDMDSMSDLVSDINQVNQTELTAQLSYVEGYENLSCYVIANEDEDAFRVYVSYDMKIKNITTLAPCLNALYVTLSSDGKYIVYLSALDEEEVDFINAADKNMEVVKLKEDITNRFSQAMAADPALAAFYQQLEQENAAASAAAIQQQQAQEQQAVEDQAAQQAAADAAAQQAAADAAAQQAAADAAAQQAAPAQ